jgi:hypothetical protein
MARNIFTVSAQSADNLGLDPAVYLVAVGIHRIDGGPLSPEEVAAARAALARIEAAPAPAPAPQAPAYPPAMADLHAVATGAKPAAE